MNEVKGSTLEEDLPRPFELLVLLLVLLLAVATRLDRVEETGELGIGLCFEFELLRLEDGLVEVEVEEEEVAEVAEVGVTREENLDQ